MKLFETKKVGKLEENKIDQFIKKGKEAGLEEFDVYQDTIFFTDGAYIEFRVKLGSDGNSIKKFTAKDGGNKKSLELKSKYPTLDKIDANQLKNIKEI